MNGWRKNLADDRGQSTPVLAVGSLAVLLATTAFLTYQYINPSPTVTTARVDIAKSAQNGEVRLGSNDGVAMDGQNVFLVQDGQLQFWALSLAGMVQGPGLAPGQMLPPLSGPISYCGGNLYAGSADGGFVGLSETAAGWVVNPDLTYTSSSTLPTVGLTTTSSASGCQVIAASVSTVSLYALTAAGMAPVPGYTVTASAATVPIVGIDYSQGTLEVSTQGGGMGAYNNDRSGWVQNPTLSTPQTNDLLRVSTTDGGSTVFQSDRSAGQIETWLLTSSGMTQDPSLAVPSLQSLSAIASRSGNVIDTLQAGGMVQYDLSASGFVENPFTSITGGQVGTTYYSTAQIVTLPFQLPQPAGSTATTTAFTVCAAPPDSAAPGTCPNPTANLSLSGGTTATAYISTDGGSTWTAAPWGQAAVVPNPSSTPGYALFKIVFTRSASDPFASPRLTHLTIYDNSTYQTGSGGVANGEGSILVQ